MNVRADFNFRCSEEKIDLAVGYVIGDFTPTEEGGDFKPEKVVLLKLKAKAPNFQKVEKLAIENCRCIYDDSEIA